MKPGEKAAEIVQKLQAANIWHTVPRVTREDAARSIEAAVPGERWEIDVLHDGTVEVEVFESQGVQAGDGILDEMIATQTEPNGEDEPK